jgi:glutaminyl-tRNA synthetase
MPTLSGMRRRGYPAEAIRRFIDLVGVSKNESLVDVALLEHCVRENLNMTAQRVMGVIKPLKVVLVNYPDDLEEQLDAVNNPESPEAGTRKVPFSKILYIDQNDFREDPPKKYFRLAPGKEVRLRYGYFIKCVDVKKDPETGQLLEVHCTYDPETRGGYAPDGRKVQGTIHWVSAQHAIDAEIRLYDRLFTVVDPRDVDEGETFLQYLNPHSVEVVHGCKLEPSLANASPGIHYQFEREGYFYVDPSMTNNGLVFNLTVRLRDTWAKIEQAQQ